MRNNERSFAAELMIIVGLVTSTAVYIKNLDGKSSDMLGFLMVTFCVYNVGLRLGTLIGRYAGIFANNGIEPANHQENNRLEPLMP